LDKNILLSIVNLATKEIKGVAGLSNKNMATMQKSPDTKNCTQDTNTPFVLGDM
jgi:uncharacterized alkaline shock family protein YloU